MAAERRRTETTANAQSLRSLATIAQRRRQVQCRGYSECGHAVHIPGNDMSCPSIPKRRSGMCLAEYRGLRGVTDN